MTQYCREIENILYADGALCAMYIVQAHCIHKIRHSIRITSRSNVNCKIVEKVFGSSGQSFNAMSLFQPMQWQCVARNKLLPIYIVFVLLQFSIQISCTLNNASGSANAWLSSDNLGS